MNTYIEKIITNSKYSLKEKKDAINSIKDDIKLAEKVLKGEFTYCPECKDYYLSKSFFDTVEQKQVYSCTYSSLINGDDEWKDILLTILYKNCPKGHKFEIFRKETKV